MYGLTSLSLIQLMVVQHQGYQAQHKQTSTSQEKCAELKDAWENLSMASDIISVASITVRDTPTQASPIISGHASTLQAFVSQAAQTARLYAASKALLGRDRDSSRTHIQDHDHAGSAYRSSPNPFEDLPLSAPTPHSTAVTHSPSLRADSNTVHNIKCVHSDHDPLSVSGEYKRQAEAEYEKMRRCRFREHWELQEEKNSWRPEVFYQGEVIRTKTRQERTPHGLRECEEVERMEKQCLEGLERGELTFVHEIPLGFWN